MRSRAIDDTHERHTSAQNSQPLCPMRRETKRRILPRRREMGASALRRDLKAQVDSFHVFISTSNACRSRSRDSAELMSIKKFCRERPTRSERRSMNRGVHSSEDLKRLSRRLSHLCHIFPKQESRGVLFLIFTKVRQENGLNGKLYWDEAQY